MPRAVVVIPARWASSRFPGKVIARLGERALVLHACQTAEKASRVCEVIVATDDERVERIVRAAGYNAVATRPDHPSGTDRVCEAIEQVKADFVIGLQADEPFLLPSDLDKLVEALADPTDPPALATLAIPASGLSDWHDPNVVKVVTDCHSRALYFSRSPLPYCRPGSGRLAMPPEGPLPESCRVHVGVYGWQRQALFDFAAMPVSPLERSEGLEQLRALEAGWSIAVLPAEGTPFGIDTPEDLQRAERWLSDQPQIGTE